MGGRQPTQPAVLFCACAKTLRFPQGLGRHPHDPPVGGPTQRLPDGKKEAAVLLRGLFSHGLAGGDGLLCLLVFKKEIHVVNALLLC